MSEKAASPPTVGLIDAFETVESISSIVSVMRPMTATRNKEFALVIIALSFENEVKASLYHTSLVEASTHYILNSLRPLVRKTDKVFLKSSAMYFLLPGATKQGGEIVQNRLWEALLWRVHNIAEQEALQPLAMSIGHSAYPLPSSEISDLLKAASTATLHFDCQPEMPTKKAVGPQVLQSQQTKEDDELPALARKMGIPYLSFLPRKLPECVQELVTPRLAQELGCYPLGRERNTLTVAMLNPQDHSILERLQQETGLLIFPVLTHPHALQAVLEQLV